MKTFSAVLAGLWLAGALAAAEPAGLIDTAALAWRDVGGHSRVADGKVVVDVPAGAAPDRHWVEAPVDLAPLKGGGGVVMSVRARWRGVTQPPQRWNGVKFMLAYTAGGKPQWHHPVGLWGEQDEWRTLNALLWVDDDAKDGRIAMGLQDSSGHVEFDLASLRFAPSFSPDGRVNMDYAIRYPDRPDMAVRRRGVMSPHTMTEDDFKTLRAWNVNLLRYQIQRNWGAIGTERDLPEYDAWLDGKLDHLEQILRWADAYGVKVIIDLHTPPGGSDGSNMGMFLEKRYFDHFITVWKRIAQRFKGNPAVWAYDLINEPRQVGPAPFDYWTVQKTAAESVRAIDPDTMLFIESNEADRPRSFAYLSPLAMDNVAYQVHVYQPLAYSHQGVGRDEPALVYPGTISGEHWDKERIRKELAPVREFQLRHQARIYVGEFSAPVWAPGAETYFDDLIALFEEYGWDWSYHAFREWDGWSVEHEGENRNTLRPAQRETPRLAALKRGFALNERQADDAGTAAAPPTVDPTPAALAGAGAKGAGVYRVLFIGNSITRHGVNASLGWTQAIGMAASARDNDYVHRFCAAVGKELPGVRVEPVYLAQGGGRIEQNFGRADDVRAAKPDLIVIQMGENEQIEKGDFAPLRAAYERLLTEVLAAAPGVPTLCLGVWQPRDDNRGYGPGPDKDGVARELAAKHRLPFASVERYASDPACRGYGAHNGVRWHPNDKGMAGYAASLFAAWQTLPDALRTPTAH